MKLITVSLPMFLGLHGPFIFVTGLCVDQKHAKRVRKNFKKSYNHSNQNVRIRTQYFRVLKWT
jgi:hypothetical protein